MTAARPGLPLGVALNALGVDASQVTVMCSGCWDGRHGLCEQPCQCTHRGTGVPGHEERPAVQLVTPAVRRTRSTINGR